MPATKTIASVMVRLSPAERDRLRIVAAHAGQSMSTFVRSVVLAAIEPTAATTSETRNRRAKD